MLGSDFMSRVTNNMLINNMLYNMGNNLSRMQKYQNQLATGKKIQTPSDDPIVASRALKLRTDVSKVEQYKRNAEDAGSWMDITESTLRNMGDMFHRTRELMVQAANGTNGPEDLKKIKDEVEQLKSQTVHLGNTTYAGRYIFSGYKTDIPLINEDGTFNIDVQNAEKINYEIGVGDDININVTGGQLFNLGADAVNGDTGSMMQFFDNVINALDAGDNDQVNSLLEEADEQINNMLRIRSGNGAKINRVELTINRIDDDIINFTEMMSKNEDVDMAEAIMNMQNEENVYRASLSSGAKVIQPSLVDFLR